MTVYQVGVYHNTDAPFQPYRPDDPVSLVFTFGLDLPQDPGVGEVAAWAFHAFNADLQMLEAGQRAGGDPMMFPIACLYRLLRLRAVSVGDVVQVVTGDAVSWLACGRMGWEPIGEPWTTQNQPLTAARVYEQITADRRR